MGHETVERLPSLAHPMIFNPFEEDANKKNFLPHQRLPYPEIDPAWGGFEFSHLHWVGIKHAHVTQGGKLTPNQRQWQMELTAYHESNHLLLSHTPFFLYRKGVYITFILLIDETFGQGETEIPVPLDHEQPRNELDEYLEHMVNLHRGAELVQEISAVRSSLLNTPGKGRVSQDYRQRWLAQCQVEYEKYMWGFTALYIGFNDIAGKIGEIAATAMVHNVLKTVNPDSAFAAILKYLWRQPDDYLRSLATLSEEDADQCFNSITAMSDPDGSRFIKVDFLEVAPLMNERLNITPRIVGTVKDHVHVIQCDFGSKDVVLVSRYRDSQTILPLEVRVWGDNFHSQSTQADFYGHYFLLAEALRQQLTVGIGLVCPYWYFSRSCCGERNRALLEKVWARTCPTSKCMLWQRLGCLQ